MPLPACRACGDPRPENVLASYACPECGERNPYAPRPPLDEDDDEPPRRRPPV